MIPKQKINIVWLKRDLRLIDHLPFLTAQREELPFLALFIFEPSIMALPESDVRHWRFVYESLLDMEQKIKEQNGQLHILYGEALEVFKKIEKEFTIQNVYSHAEVGLKAVRKRNESLQKYFKKHHIHWEQYNQDAIIFGAKNRIGWEENRLKFLNEPIQTIGDKFNTVSLPHSFSHDAAILHLPISITQRNFNFQQGGQTQGEQYLESFLNTRYTRYLDYISKAAHTEETCSRLSPYLSYGCLSLRQVYQVVFSKYQLTKDDNLSEYLKVLYQRSHYIQQLETEPELEFYPINRALLDLDKEYDEELYLAWEKGETGYPFVDATVRCLEKTGYANFRMRETLATFATFGIWQDWKKAAIRMARLFLDFEPSIHYAQMQIHAGLTGYHVLRVYNPSAQSGKHDKEGVFVKKWLPQLKHIPSSYLGKIWTIPKDVQQSSNCIIGKDYPAPIIDFEIASNIAQRHYWTYRQGKEVFKYLPTIFERHCLPRDIPKYQEVMKLNMKEKRKIS